MIPLLAGLAWLPACTGHTTTTDSAQPLLGPVLSHTAPEGPFVAGEAIALSAEASDEDGVAAVDMVYRVEGGDYWETLSLAAQTGSDTWLGEVPDTDVDAPALEYYFRAADALGITSFLPLDNAASPYSLAVADKGTPLPFHEDFEDYTAGYGPLYSIGWASVADGFGGYPYEISLARAWDGEAAVLHPRGYEGIALLDDWLLAPSLDFSGVDAVQVSWYETGSATELADHSLWISTVDRDPRSDTHELVAELPAPAESGFERSAVYDLSAWAGEPVVYLAWHYLGEYADDWTLDAVSVRELTCDPALTLDWLSGPVSPGDTASLAVDVVNGLDVGCAGLTATVSFPEGGATADGELSLGDLEAGGALAGTFQVDVDLETPDNSYLAAVLTVSDGLDSWTLEQDLLIGAASELRVELDVTSEGVVQLVVGVGDPEAPDWSVDLAAESLLAGTYSYDLDITDQHELLPPRAGDDRWFLEIDASGSGSVTLFEIDHDSWTYPGSSESWWGDEDPVVAWLPEPADPVLASTLTDPDPIAPGDEVTVSLNLRNDGATTSDAVTATLSSSDADATVLTTDPAELTTAPWAAGSTAAPVAFTVQVSPDHVDSTDLALVLTLDDGVETWELPVTLSVPWVVVKATSIEIDDSSGGNGDGLLDAGETATLEIDLTNVGDLDADGFVDAVATIDSASTASAALGEDSDTLSSLGVDATKTADFEVTVDAGASPGDTLILSLASTDDRATYTTPVSLVLGEPPWLSVSPIDDDRGDAYGYTFDLLNVLYRVKDDHLELLFQAGDTYDPATAFVELWGVASSGDYVYYRMAMQSGKATLQGYDSGFVDLGEPAVTNESATDLKISWPLSDMDPAVTSLQVGFGAGWCSTDTESFCDHFPDGWGYYYHSTYSTSSFFSLRW